MTIAGVRSNVGGTEMLRPVLVAGRAVSRRIPPGRLGAVRRGAGLAPSCEGLDEDHMPAAARARRARVERFLRPVVIGRRDAQQLAGAFKVGLACRAGEQAVMADAVKAARQDVEQEPADELVGGERHELLPVGSVATVVLVAEGDAGLVEGDQAAVRDGDPVGLARQVGEHRLGTCEGRLGVDGPALLPDGDRWRRKARRSARCAMLAYGLLGVFDGTAAMSYGKARELLDLALFVAGRTDVTLADVSNAIAAGPSACSPPCATCFRNWNVS